MKETPGRSELDMLIMILKIFQREYHSPDGSGNVWVSAC